MVGCSYSQNCHDQLGQAPRRIGSGVEHSWVWVYESWALAGPGVAQSVQVAGTAIPAVMGVASSSTWVVQVADKWALEVWVANSSTLVVWEANRFPWALKEADIRPWVRLVGVVVVVAGWLESWAANTWSLAWQLADKSFLAERAASTWSQVELGVDTWCVASVVASTLSWASSLVGVVVVVAR